MSAVNIHKIIAFVINLFLVASVFYIANADGSDKAILLVLFYLPVLIILNVLIWLLLRKLKPAYAATYKETSVMLTILFFISFFTDDLFLSHIIHSVMISFIAAVSDNNVIGRDNQLPWHLPADLKYFKNTTWALPVIMGRKTFESFPKALPGRTNIVITRQENYAKENITIAGNLDEALQKAAELQTEEIFIIGGSEIFRQAWQQADHLYITRVHTTVDGDAFFPEIKETEWKLLSGKELQKDEKNAFDYAFEVWERR